MIEIFNNQYAHKKIVTRNFNIKIVIQVTIVIKKINLNNLKAKKILRTKIIRISYNVENMHYCSIENIQSTDLCMG